MLFQEVFQEKMHWTTEYGLLLCFIPCHMLLYVCLYYTLCYYTPFFAFITQQGIVLQPSTTRFLS
jgi:hypothetical protein